MASLTAYNATDEETGANHSLFRIEVVLDFYDAKYCITAFISKTKRWNFKKVLLNFANLTPKFYCWK